MLPKRRPVEENRSTGSLVAGAAAGAIGGLVASWLMVVFQHRVWPPPKGDKSEPSTTKLARRLAKLRGDKVLTDERAATSGEIVHYALGAGLGLIYGAAASTRPAVAIGAGLPFGVVTEIAFDQALVPALGLSNPFWKCPVEWHLRGLAAHLVFGVTTEVSRRLLLTIFGAATSIPVGHRRHPALQQQVVAPVHHQIAPVGTFAGSCPVAEPD